MVDRVLDLLSVILMDLEYFLEKYVICLWMRLWKIIFLYDDCLMSMMNISG